MHNPPPVLEHACDLTVELGPIREMGRGRHGMRRIVPVVGGQFEGPLLNGQVLGVGADWQTGWSDGLSELDTRYALETHDGAVIEIRNYGYRHGPPEVLAALARGEAVDPSSYYMRTQARLETGDDRYRWVNRTLFIGNGRRLASAVAVSLFALR